MLNRARALQPQLTEWRRAIHRYPEIGFDEHRTAALVAGYLRKLGLKVATGIAGTGVVGYLGSGRPAILLRADMDALQIQEANTVPYASERPGLMHACGHDAHVTCLLGAATLLAQDPPPGQVQFLFQPSEEGSDAEGKQGAERVMEAGYTEDVDAVVGLHSFPDLLAGTVAVREGPVTSAADMFQGTVIGRSCHGAYPQNGVDAIAVAAQVVNAIHQIVARRIPPLESGVITIGTINGGTRHNVVADRVAMIGTMRSFQPAVRQQLAAELERAFKIAEVLGGSYVLAIERGPDSVINDPELASLVRKVGSDLLGPEHSIRGEVSMGSEDFPFLTRHAPGCFFRLGVGFPGEPARSLHNPHFDVDETALPIGAAMLAETARRFLAERRA